MEPLEKVALALTEAEGLEEVAVYLGQLEEREVAFRLGGNYGPSAFWFLDYDRTDLHSITLVGDDGLDVELGWEEFTEVATPC